ncbi:unnamed protein product [Ectocarpus sp. 12 AP-2014]
MGCGASVFAAATTSSPRSPQKLKAQGTAWKIVPGIDGMKKELSDDKSLTGGDPRKLEMRAILEDPIGQKYIGQFAKKAMTQESFYAWVDIQEFRSIPTADYRRGKSMHIYQKYIREGAVLQARFSAVGSIPAEERAKIKHIIDAGVVDKAGNKSGISTDMFDFFRKAVFKEMFYNTFQRFSSSPEYAQMHADIKNAYNKASDWPGRWFAVCPDDFLYIERIGEGGFGRVVHVKKKTTQSHYAMKIQLKTALLDTFNDDPTRIDHERRVLSVTHHPFIVGMDYAFQTPELGIMCLELVTGGDLQEAIDTAPEGRIEAKRVQFYSAEIILALVHLHDLGLMYRDLKPCNVLLMGDGHVKLADMGGVAEFADGTCLETNKDKNPFTGTEIGSLPQGKSSEDGPPTLNNKHRRRSIMGTQGYMAPEMVILPKQPRSVRVGYSNAVDYWSLGVTVFKLLTGSRPFDRRRFQAFVDDTRCRMGLDQKKYNELLDTISWPEYVGSEARSVISGLLACKETERLGGTPENLLALKSHEFFEGIDWLRLSQRHVLPPYLPKVPPLREEPLYQTFDHLMRDFYAQQEMESATKDTYDWFVAPTDEDQAFFNSWDFVSMHTLKIELGISSEMAVHDQSFKVRQLLGDEPEKRRRSLRTKRGSSSGIPSLKK